MIKRVIILNLLLIHGIMFSQCFGQQLDSLGVITKFFEANGGENNWRAVKTLRSSATMKKYVNGVVDTEIEAFWEVKGNSKQKYYSKKVSELFGSTLCLNDSVFWRESGLGNVEVLPDDHMEYYKATMGFGNPLFFLREDMQINFLGVRSFLGTNYYAFQLKGKGWHLASIQYINIQTFLIVYAHAENNTGMCTKFSDYRIVNGLMFPFKEEGFGNGYLELRSTTIINDLKVNQPIPDSVFDMPK